MRNQNNMENKKNRSSLRYASLFCAGILVLNSVRTPVYVWAWEQGKVSEAETEPGAEAGRLEITVTGPSAPIIEGYSEAEPYKIQITNPADGVDLSGFEVWTTNYCDVYALVMNEETGTEEEILLYHCPEGWNEGLEFLGLPNGSEEPDNQDDLQGENADGSDTPEKPDSPMDADSTGSNGESEDIGLTEDAGPAESTSGAENTENSNEANVNGAETPKSPEDIGSAGSAGEPDGIGSPESTDKTEGTGSAGSTGESDGTGSAGSINEPEGTGSAGGTGGSEKPEDPGKEDISEPENPKEPSGEDVSEPDEEGTQDNVDGTSETYLASGESRSYLMRIPTGLPAGEYTETIIFQASEMEEPLKRSVSFVVQSSNNNGENTDVPSEGSSSEGTAEDQPSDSATEDDPSAGGAGGQPSDGSVEDDPSVGGTEDQPSGGDSKDDPSAGDTGDQPSDGSAEGDPSAGNTEGQPSDGATEDDPSAGNTEDDPSVGGTEEEGSGDSAADKDSGEFVPDEPVTEDDGEGEIPNVPELSEEESGNEETDVTEEEGEKSEEEDGKDEESEEPAEVIPLEVISRESGNYIGDTFFAMSAVVYELIVDPAAVSALYCDLNGTINEIPISDGTASFTLPDTYNGTVRFYTLGLDGSIMEEITEYVVAEPTAPTLNYENVTSPDDETSAVHVSIEDCGDIISGLNYVNCMVDGVPYTEYTTNVFGTILLCSGEEAVSGLSFDIPLLDDEVHTIDVSATDNAGNLLEQSFRVHAAPVDVVSVVLPTSFGMTIYPYASNGNIWGDDIVIANQSEFPVEVTLQSAQVNIDHTLPEDRIMKSTIPVGNTVEQPIDLTQLEDDTVKDAFLNLNLKMLGDQNSVLELEEGYSTPGNQFVLEPKNPDTDFVAIQSDPSEKSVTSGDYAIVNVRGTIAEGSESMWKDGDIAVSLTFTFQKLQESEDEAE